MEINHFNSIILLIVLPLTILATLCWCFAYTKSANGLRHWLLVIGLTVFIPLTGVTLIKYGRMLSKETKNNSTCRMFEPSITVSPPPPYNPSLLGRILYRERPVLPFCPGEREKYDRHVERWKELREEFEVYHRKKQQKDNKQQNAPDTLEKQP